MKYLLITLIVQDGENRHDHRILHTTPGKDIHFAAERYAASFYGNNVERLLSWWQFNAGSIAVELFSVVELSEYEYNLMKAIFDGDEKPKRYFSIVQAGIEKGLQREEVEINCGENGKIMIHQDDDKLGFIIDVYGQNDLADTMTVWEEDLIDDEDAPNEKEIKAYLKGWGQKQGEITSNLGYPKSHSESDELLMEDYFFLEGRKEWYPKISRMYIKREQLIADYIRNNRDNY